VPAVESELEVVVERRKKVLPSEARGSVKEAIGKVNGDVRAEAEGAAEVKAARERNREASHRDDQKESPARRNCSSTRNTIK